MLPSTMLTRPDDPTPLRRAREAVGYSQARLARLSGVHPSCISLAERCGLLTAAMARRLAPALGVQPEALLPPTRGVDGE